MCIGGVSPQRAVMVGTAAASRATRQVKAGDPLTREDIGILVAQKELVEKLSNCPHGRPPPIPLRALPLRDSATAALSSRLSKSLPRKAPEGRSRDAVYVGQALMTTG